MGRMSVSGEAIYSDVRFLCDAIGTRNVGTRGEVEAARYIADRFKENGLQGVSIEEFDQPLSCQHREASLKVPSQGGRVIDCYPLGFCRSTPEGGNTSDLLVVDPIGLKTEDLKGKIALCAHPDYEYVVGKEMDGLVVADMTPWPTYHNLYQLAEKGPIPPGVSISLPDAYTIIGLRMTSAYLNVQQDIKEVKAHNVVAALPGRTRQFIAVFAHFDSVPVGGTAADNAGGVAMLLGLARSMAGLKLRRGIKFIALSAEEVGSGGAVMYAKKHLSELDDCVFAINIDGGGAILGRNLLSVTGSDSVLEYIKKVISDTDHNVSQIGLTPGSMDSLPFNIKGIPSLYYNRNHYNTHSHHDTSYLLSAERLKESTEFLAELLTRLAQIEKLPFSEKLPNELIQKATESLLARGYSFPFNDNASVGPRDVFS